jgi:hypothetical protein
MPQWKNRVGRVDFGVRPLPHAAVTGPDHGPRHRPSVVWFGRIVLEAVAVLFGVVGAAAAQLLSIGGLDGQLGFTSTYENQDISHPQQHQHLDRLYLEERGGVRTRGYFYDPDLLRFTAGVELGWFEDHMNNKTDGTSTSLSGDGSLTGFDADVNVLGAKSYGFDVFGNRSEGFTRRDFAGQVKTDLERYGVTWRLQNLPLSSYVSVEQQDIRQRFTLVPAGVQQDERRRMVSYYGERRSSTSTLTVDYHFDDVLDRVLTQGAYQVHSGGVFHLWRFGDYLDDNLASSAQAYNRSGDVSGTTIFEHEELQLRHSRYLTSTYGYTFAMFNQSGSGTTMSHNGFASLQHQLYESLTSSGNVNAGYTELSPGQDVTYGGGLGLGYRKQIPWDATFFATVGTGYQLDDRAVPSGQLAVIDEPHAFPPEEDFLLVNVGVIDSTIVVTDSTKSVIYEPQVDYLIDNSSPPFTRLQRNPISPGRGIPPGGAVLVSYSFKVSGALKVGSRSINLSAGLDFKWLSLFYSGQRLRQDLFTGSASDIFGPVNADTMGVETHWRSDLGEGRLLNEYLTYDANDLRYQAFSFTQSALGNPRRWLTVGLTGTESFYDFSVPRRNRTFFSERGSVGWRSQFGVTVDAFVGFHYQRQTAVPLNQLVEFGTHARWIAGLFTLSLGYDHAVQDIGAFSRAGDLVRFDVIRRF